jgi:hypothetical protein
LLQIDVFGKFLQLPKHVELDKVVDLKLLDQVSILVDCSVPEQNGHWRTFSVDTPARIKGATFARRSVQQSKVFLLVRLRRKAYCARWFVCGKKPLARAWIFTRSSVLTMHLHWHRINRI